jgi:hypothetical protein
MVRSTDLFFGCNAGNFAARLVQPGHRVTNIGLNPTDAARGAGGQR